MAQAGGHRGGSGPSAGRGAAPAPSASTRRKQAAAVGAAAAFAGWASTTSPFSVGSDVAVSVFSLALMAALVHTLRSAGRHRRPPAAQRRGPPEPPATPRSPLAGALPWLVVIAVVVTVELVSYAAGGSRAVHPTLSSGAESAFHVEAVKATAIFGWMAGGWYLVRR